MKEKILRKLVRALLKILHDWLGQYLEDEIGSHGALLITRALNSERVI